MAFPKIGIKTNISKSDSTRLLARAKKFVGINYLFDSGVTTYSKNRTVNVIYIGKPSSGSDISPL